MNEYELKKDEHGDVWVAIQPLQRDIVKHIKLLAEVSIDDLDKYDQKEYDMKLIGLQQVYSFLGALLLEQQLADKQGELH